MVKPMKQVPLTDVKDDLSKYLRLATKEEIVITRHGKPAGILVGFASEDEWFDYKLEHDPRFLARIAKSRASLRARKRGQAGKLKVLAQTNSHVQSTIDSPTRRQNSAGAKRATSSSLPNRLNYRQSTPGRQAAASRNPSRQASTVGGAGDC